MARLPDATSFGARPIPQPSRGIATISPSAAGAVGNAVSDLGDTVSRIGFEAIDREATAAAKERDVLVSERIRALLYDPQGGYANLSGGMAVQKRESVLEALDGIKSSAMEGLDRPAQKKLEDALRNRIESAKLTIDRHASGERKTWIDGASSARIESAYQDSIINPAETNASLDVIKAELQGRAVRDGWSSEQLALETQKATSKVYNDQVIRLASSDPVSAMQYLREKQDQMLPSDVVNLEAKLQPAVKKFVGWQKGREIFANVSAPAMASFKALEDAAGFPLKVTSGYRDPSRNAAVGGAKGSQHLHGNAFDIDVSGLSLAQRKDLIVKARAAGFSGVGVYGTSLHFDVGGDRAWGPSYGRESLPAWAAEAVTSPIGDQPSMWETVLAEEDPVIRDSMIESINLQQSVMDGQRKAEAAAARDAAFQMIEAGGMLTDLPLEQRQALGEEAMSSLMTYQSKKNAGTPIETDPEAYLGLRRLQANDPAAFRNVDMTTYVHRLSETDWQAFVDAQNKPKDQVNSVAASTLMETAKRHMSAAGIDPSPKEGSDGAKKVAEIQTQLLIWQDQYIKDKGETPPQIEIDRRIAKMLAPVTINPRGLLNEVDVRAFELGGVDIPADEIKGADIIVDDTRYDPSIVRKAMIYLQIKKEKVTAENVVSTLNDAAEQLEAAGFDITTENLTAMFALVWPEQPTWGKGR